LPNLENDKLALAQKLKDRSKYREALDILRNIENVNDLPVDEQIRFYLLQSFLFFELGLYSKALDAADWVFQKSIETENNLAMLDASIARSSAFYGLGKKEECDNSILKCEDIFSRLKDQPEEIIWKRKAGLSRIKGWYFLLIGKFDKSLEYLKTNLVLCEKYGTNRDMGSAFFCLGKFFFFFCDFTKGLENYKNVLKISKELNNKIGMAWAYNNIGDIYRLQGDLERALQYFELSLSIKKELENKEWIAVTLGNIGWIYYEKGDNDKGLNYSKKGLQLFKEICNNFRISQALFDFIWRYLDQNDLESAQICLEDLRKIKDNEENLRINNLFLIAQALMLKKTGSNRNIVRAEDILSKLLEEKLVASELLVIILLNLVELLYMELQITNETKILEEIHQLITRLLEIAEITHSFSLLAEVYLFKAKLELINFQITETQRLLIRAQQITQQYHLPRLEKKISMEHDQFLDKLDIWKELKHRNAPLAERLKRFSLEDDLKLMMRKKAIEDVEILPEKPLLLSIIAEGGVSLFTHFFSKEWEKKPMFSSFMTAFNSFSHEFFAKTLDRVKIGENTIIMAPFDENILCYVIKGQTYPAQQKLNTFLEGIKNSQVILDAINRSFSSGALLSEENTPVLGELVNTIFA